MKYLFFVFTMNAFNNLSLFLFLFYLFIFFLSSFVIEWCVVKVSEMFLFTNFVCYSPEIETNISHLRTKRENLILGCTLVAPSKLQLKFIVRNTFIIVEDLSAGRSRYTKSNGIIFFICIVLLFTAMCIATDASN